MGYVNETNNMHAIYCYQIYGPVFGCGFDLYQDKDGTWRSNCSFSYPKFDTPENYKESSRGCKLFNVENYEVFQVIEK